MSPLKKFRQIVVRQILRASHSTDLKFEGNGLQMIEVMILPTVLYLGLLMVVGWFRRNKRFGIFNTLLGWAYVGTPSLISYILGRMNRLSTPDNVLYAFCSYLATWATILLISYASADSINAMDLNNNDDYKKFMVQFLVFVSLLAWVIIENYCIFDVYMFVISILWVIVVMKVEERARAFWYASKSGVAKTTRILTDFMMYEHKMSNEIDPATLKGYKYLVEVRDLHYSMDPPCYLMSIDIDKAVTVEKIWECHEVEHLSSNSDQLKDLCLSMSLFWLLLRRFGGYRLYEAIYAPEKTWKFVDEGLLAGDSAHERVFRVIEVELKFLYDLFYTKYYASHIGAWQCRKRFAQLAIIVTFTIFHTWLTYYLYGSSEVHTATSVLLTIIIVVDFMQTIILFTSEWYKVRWICWYVQKQPWKTKRGSLWRKFIQLLCYAPNRKPWSRKLGQYSLLHNHGYNPCIYKLARRCLGDAVDIPRVGQKESSSIKLSDEVMKALIKSLREHGQDIHNNGISVWRRNNVSHEWLYEGCKLETQTHAILVWHIATSFCEMSCSDEGQALTEHAPEDFKVAKGLSMYCAYLVAFAPKLLPDPKEITKSIFDQVINEANELFLSKDKDKEKYDKMSKMSIGGIEFDQKYATIRMGVLIGERLMSMFTVNTRWSCLAEFWAEMLLFLAPSNDHMAHAEHLAKGGELITHLWALLTHAGIVVRREVDSFPTNSTTTTHDADIEG